LKTVIAPLAVDSKADYGVFFMSPNIECIVAKSLTSICKCKPNGSSCPICNKTIKNCLQKGEEFMESKEGKEIELAGSVGMNLEILRNYYLDKTEAEKIGAEFMEYVEATRLGITISVLRAQKEEELKIKEIEE
jgi:hypothetical protein